MGTTKEAHMRELSTRAVNTQAVLDRAATTEPGTYEWWTAVSTFADGDFALEPDPLLTSTDATVDEIELRLYAL
jgi:hypothetical protein